MFSDDIEYTSNIEELNKFKSMYENKDNKFIAVNFNDISVGDIIYIEFSPYSQKYVYDLYPLFGTIQSIDSAESAEPTNSVDTYDRDDLADRADTAKSNYINYDELNIERIMLNLNNKIFPAYHNWVSYFGISRGYEYSIYKLMTIEKFNYYISPPSTSDSNSDSTSDSTSETNNAI